MSWTPLSQRITYLPLILAGPILRRTEPTTVTVWIALKEACVVTLKVYATRDGNGSAIAQLMLEGSRETAPIGQYLHVVAVTAQSIDQGQLEPGQIYAYDLDFSGKNLSQALNSEGFFPRVPISYFSHQLPTFAMPSDDLNHLQMLHGSCRKPHGGERDALSIVDDLIQYNARQPNLRPQQLFLTGDQIYGDDVADPLLWAVQDASKTLLGWEENLPLVKLPLGGYESKPLSEFKPGSRTEIAKDYGGFTAMLVNKPEKAKSHLFGLGEYYAIYLFSWSPILWPNQFPQLKNPRKEPKLAKLWDQEAHDIERFARDLWKIRRAIANVSTYMICDDHDVSDDFFLNREWCDRVLGKPLGRRVVQNGLLAYAIFQAWGNTPDQFTQNQSGEKLLAAAQKWSESGGTDELIWEKISHYLGLPDLEENTHLPKLRFDETVLILDRNYADGIVPLTWDYRVRSFKHEVLVLDTRTWRGYPNGEESKTAPPMLLSPTAFHQQIELPLQETDQQNQAGKSAIEVTLVVVPTNLVSLSIIDWVQRWDMMRGKVFNSDVGDSWNLNQEAFANLLAAFFNYRDRVVVLSGDIHYACAVRLNYWSRCHYGNDQPHLENTQSAHVLAQLTASAFKNAELSTQVVTTKIKSILPEKPEHWLGWNDPPDLIEIQVIDNRVQLIALDLPNKSPILYQMQPPRGNERISWEIVIEDENSLPDWHYSFEWIHREKAIEVPWESHRESSPYLTKKRNLKDFLKLLWGNEWLQEGKEVIGHSNIGLIHFQWSENEDEKAVIQDSYWRPPWKRTSIFYSRYFVPLRLEEPPPLPRVMFTD